MRVLSNLVSVEMDKATFEHHAEFLRKVVNEPQISYNKVTCIMNLVDRAAVDTGLTLDDIESTAIHR